MNELLNFPRPAVTIDCVVFGYDCRSVSLLLINIKEGHLIICGHHPEAFYSWKKRRKKVPAAFLKIKPGCFICI